MPMKQLVVVESLVIFWLATKVSLSVEGVGLLQSVS